MIDLPIVNGAACKDLPPEVADEYFFREGTVPPAAKKLCASCPAQQECREYAMATGVEGFWGGTTRIERERERRKLGVKPEGMTLPAYFFVDTNWCHTFEKPPSSYTESLHSEAGEGYCAACKANSNIQRRKRKARQALAS